MLIPSDTVANLGQHRSEGGFADIERITSEVVAVQFDEVERVEEYVVIIAPIANVVEGRDTIIVATGSVSASAPEQSVESAA
jgi:hypothetical protein